MDSPWPAYGFAILSALLWAVSAQILNVGLRRLPASFRIEAIMAGLLFSQLAGLFTLLQLLDFNSNNRHLSPYLTIAGIFTFPLATGMYYLAGNAFGQRLEIASQFAKIKPLLSLLLAILVLGEPIERLFSVSSILVVTGVLLFVWSGITGMVRWNGVIFGSATALFWSLGEVFMGLGFQGQHSLADTFVALCSATLVSTPFLLPSFIKLLKKRLIGWHWLWPFIVHGILSFAFAYSLFFTSIEKIGLSASVLINAFWPVLALLLARLIEKFKGQRGDIPAVIWAAAVFLLMGSVIQAFNIED